PLAEERNQDPEEVAARQDQQIAEVAAKLEAKVASESRDEQWSAPTERAIAELFRSDKASGSRLIAADCRQDLCRAHIPHDSPARRLELLNDLRFTPPFDTEGFVQKVGAAENPESIVYIARANTDLIANQ